MPYQNLGYFMQREIQGLRKVKGSQQGAIPPPLDAKYAYLCHGLPGAHIFYFDRF